METSQNSINKIDFMISNLTELKKLKLEKGQEPFYYVVDYRIHNLEADKLYIQSQKYGDAGTTKNGFGCKIRPLIIESAHLRNNSALKGFEAVNLAYEFIKRYPEEAKFVNLSNKNALFLNATYYQVSKDAVKDSGIINYFCSENITLELYKEEFRKTSNLSEDYINNVRYDEAVRIWKELREIS